MEEPIIDTFSYHYPPELLQVLGKAIPKLCRSKDDLISFFRGAGVKTTMLKPYEDLLEKDRNSFKKYDVTRKLLVELNEQGDKALFARREIIRRAIDVEDFDVCFDNDRDAARGLVYQLREMVGRKDSSTRMRIEKEEEKLKYLRQKEIALAVEQKKKERIKKVRSDLNSLISDKDPHKRGKSLEKVLNELFDCYGILVRDAFTISGDHSEGIIEQIDGLIELDNNFYLVEMKWWTNTIGRKEMAEHIVRIANRGGQVRGLFISYSKYSDAAILECRYALNRSIVVILATIEEIVKLLENEGDLKSWLKTKSTAAIIDKKPLLL